MDEPRRTADLAPRMPDPWSGPILGLGHVLMVALILQHPEHTTSEMAGAIREIAAQAGRTRAVHGGLIALMLVVLHGYVGLARHLGWELARVRAGAIAYAVGAMWLAGAALQSGFVVSGLTERYAGASSADAELLAPLFALSWEINQTLARAGTLALSAAIVSWSCVLLGRGRFALAIGVLGIVVGALTAAGLLSGHLRLGVHGIALVTAGQAAWGVCAGAWLLRASATRSS